ncbi:MAG: glutathione S-transferase family protein, partial [Myxococcota bacterium]
MGRLVEGVWKTGWFSANERGEFKRQETTYRDFVRADGSTEFAPEAGRYHLYVAHACPWANRTLIMRRLKGLEDAIDVSFVGPRMGEDGWVFDGDHPDQLFGHSFLRDVYLQASSTYTGRVTVPVLWDKKLERVVNNESREIIRMLDHEFSAITKNDVDYAPKNLRDEIEETITAIYEPINNGVYRSGFATTQSAYEGAVTDVFQALDHWDAVLATQRYLCGSAITEADICMFATLIRFDLVYHGHFKCNIRRISDYPNLSGYTRDLFQTPGFGDTVDFEKVKEHYYW